MNAKSELKFISNEITSEELDETLNQITLAINNGTDLFDDDTPELDIAFENINENEEIENLEEVNHHELEVTNFIDLSTSLLNNNDPTDNQEEEESIMNHGDLDFDVDELINNFESI
jgi:hypothetical protein